jgi:hypothetical protein
MNAHRRTGGTSAGTEGGSDEDNQPDSAAHYRQQPAWAGVQAYN